MIRLLLILCFIGQSAWAQTLPVQSGEHGSFTRLAIPLPTGSDWNFSRTDAGYELGFTTANPRFDLSQIYNLIDRRRLKTIWADPNSGQLQLGIGCACHAEAALWQDRWVVVDIKDGAPASGSAFEQTRAGVTLPPLGDLGQPRPRQRPSETNQTTYDWRAAKAEMERHPTSPALAGGFESQQDLAGLRNALISNLDRAGAGGVVRFAPLVSLDTKVEKAASQENDTHFAIDDDTALAGNGKTCPAPNDFDLASWAAGENPSTDMAQARAAILGEFDKVDATGLLTAVKVHLFYSFGAEARTLLTGMGANSTTAPELWAMSYLVDGTRPESNPFEGQENCPGATALWALAAMPAKPAPVNVQANAVVQTFMSLPAPLKEVMASDLAAKLEASGNASQADILLNTLTRSTPPESDTGFLVAAQLALDRKDPGLAQKALDHIETPTSSAQALLLRAELAFDTKSAIDPAFLTELEALHFSQGKGQDGPAITRALALAKALTGDFKEAFALAQPASATAQDLWAFLPQGAGDSAFLAQTAAATREDQEALSPATRLQIADRLLDLGLPNLANDWILPTDGQPERLAALHLAQRDARSALQALVGLDSTAATDLRIQAFESMGLFDRAAELLEREGRAEEATRLRRWAGEWDVSQQAADSPWRTLAQAAQQDTETDGPVTLSATRAILTQTEEQLSAIRALLDQTTLE